jgi:hypothetical protein
VERQAGYDPIPGLKKECLGGVRAGQWWFREEQAVREPDLASSRWFEQLLWIIRVTRKIVGTRWTFRNKSSFRRVVSGRHTRQRFAAFTRVYPVRAGALAFSRVTSARCSRDREDLYPKKGVEVFAIMKSPPGSPAGRAQSESSAVNHIQPSRHAGNSP